MTNYSCEFIPRTENWQHLAASDLLTVRSGQCRNKKTLNAPVAGDAIESGSEMRVLYVEQYAAAEKGVSTPFN